MAEDPFAKEARLQAQYKEWQAREAARGRDDKAASYGKMIKDSKGRQDAHVKHIQSGGGGCSVIVIAVLTMSVVGTAAAVYYA